MTKKIKIILISLLAALFACCIAAVGFSPKSAKADTVQIIGFDISDSNFSFVSGASVQTGLFDVDPNSAGFDLATAKTMLGYDFKLENFGYENLADSVPHAHPWFTMTPSPNVFIYEFTLLRSNNDGDGVGNFGTAVEQSSILVVLFPDAHKNFYGYIAEKDYYTGATISANLLEGNTITANTSGYDTDYENIANNGDYYNWENVRRYFGKGYTITRRVKITNNKNNLAFYQEDGLKLRLIARVNSPFSYYFVKARYLYNISYDSMSNTRTIAYGEIYSSSRSVANVLQRMQDAGVSFEETFGDRANWANRILAVDNTQRVKIKYLTEIAGTPYATHAFTYVDVPLLQETIYLADVEQVLGFSISKCLDSNFKCFTKCTDDGVYYKAEYYKNVWLRAITVDGNYYDYFLDTNESYKDVYKPYVDAGVLDEHAYEWIFSTQIVSKYPALVNYHVSDVYGYFGICVIPETYTFNSVFKTMFDVETSKIGIISTFSFERTLSYDNYNNLLRNFNYGFLARVWSNVQGWVIGEERNATYYIFYSEPGTENALIGEGGQTDAENPESVVEGKVLKPVGRAVGIIWDSFLGALSSFSILGSVMRIFLGILLLLLFGFLVVKLVILVFPKDKRKNKK